MRKTKNITKRVAIAILAATMMMTAVSVSVAQPVTVWALNVEEGQTVQQTETDIDENRGHIVTNSEGITVTENGTEYQYPDATIDTNNGTVLNNYRHIGENYGTLGANDEDGQVNVNGRIDAEDKVGTIETSYGKVVENHGVITENAAEPTVANYASLVSDSWDRGVITNAPDGVIVENSGATYENQGTINKNTGFVTAVTGTDAVVVDNEGTITTVGMNNNNGGGKVELNGADATIGNLKRSGIVTNNFGTIANSDGGTIINQYNGSVHGNSSVTKITNYFDGTLTKLNNGSPITVTNNFADVTEETDEVTARIITADGVNQYRSVSFVAAENSSVSYNDDFTRKTLLKSDGTRGETKYYINVTGGDGSGTITIVAEQGYKVGLNANASANGTNQTDTYGFTYELVPDGNNYKLNITGYNGNSCELSADMFGLVVSAIQNVNPDPNPNPSPSPNPNPSPNPQPSPGPQPNPSPGPQPSPANPDTPGYPSIITVPVVQYANNARYSSIMAMPSIAMPNIANANEMHNMVSIISGTPMGGTAMLAITGDRFDASVVAALLSRRDINANIACFVNGRLSLIVIPANADLTGVIEADGSIKIARLADTFGVTGM